MGVSLSLCPLTKKTEQRQRQKGQKGHDDDDDEILVKLSTMDILILT
jgi:hypothetical protein